MVLISIGPFLYKKSHVYESQVTLEFFLYKPSDESVSLMLSSNVFDIQINRESRVYESQVIPWNIFCKNHPKAKYPTDVVVHQIQIKRKSKVLESKVTLEYF